MPRQVDHAARRAEITLGVWAVIAGGGLPAVSFRSVAEAAGVSAGRVQHYFPNRRALIEHACRSMIEHADSEFSESAPAEPAGRLRAVLVEQFPRTPTFLAGARVWHAFVTEAVVDDGLGQIIRDAKSGLETELAGLLGSAGAQSRHARALLALSDGLATRCLIGSLTADEATQTLDEELRRVLQSP